MMLNRYFPYEYVESVFTIDYQKLYDRGIRAIIFDIDNTLVHHGEDSTPQVDALFRHIHSLGLRTLLLSNNNDARICRFLRNIDTHYIAQANKPNPAGYKKALSMLNLSSKEVVCVGDQVFTDICGANRCHIPSILVKYMRYPNEKKIGIKRNLEKIILKCYQMRPSRQRRLGDVRTEEFCIHEKEAVL